jgi:hypothetical protein
MNITKQEQEALLGEYAGCAEKVSRLDALIWQTASVLLPITLAGLAYFGIQTKHSLDRFFTIAIVGIGSITLILAWYLLSRTWYFYQRVAFFRMREIEKELDLWHYRYSIFVRQPSRLRKTFRAGLDEADASRFKELDQEIPEIFHVGLRRTMTVVTFMFISGWCLLIAREVYYNFLIVHP